MYIYNVWDTIDIIFRREHRETALDHSSLSLNEEESGVLYRKWCIQESQASVNHANSDTHTVIPPV